jgi:hypothetical protein
MSSLVPDVSINCNDYQLSFDLSQPWRGEIEE